MLVALFRVKYILHWSGADNTTTYLSDLFHVCRHDDEKSVRKPDHNVAITVPASKAQSTIINNVLWRGSLTLSNVTNQKKTSITVMSVRRFIGSVILTTDLTSWIFTRPAQHCNCNVKTLWRRGPSYRWLPMPNGGCRPNCCLYGIHLVWGTVQERPIRKQDR